MRGITRTAGWRTLPLFLAGTTFLAGNAERAAGSAGVSAVRPRQSSSSAGTDGHDETVRAIAPLRARDSLAHALIQEGLRRSETLRQMRLTLAGRDVIVYVATSSRECRAHAKTTLFAASETCRYLSITLPVTSCSPRSSSERLVGVNELIAWLGHELHHAVEIALAASARDQKSVRQLFQRIGHWKAEFDGYETAGALETQHIVARELSKR